MESELELADKFLNGELSFSEYTERFDDDPEPEQDADEGTSKSRPRERRQRRQRRQLTPALAGLMGEANLRYARGDRDVAEKMCYEIIRQVPTAFEPYQTLAQIHEADAPKWMQFSLLAAHLNPSESEQWVRLAETSRRRGDLKQASLCYSRAIAADPKSVPYHEARLALVAEMIDRGVAPPGNMTPDVCRLTMISHYPESAAAKILQMAKEVAANFHRAEDLPKACKAMDKAYDRFPGLFGPQDLNLYLELLIGLKRYGKCLQIFAAHCGVEIEEEMQIGDGPTEPTVVGCSAPTTIPIDLRAKLIVCLIHTKAHALVGPFLDDVVENEDVEAAGDIYLDIEEALTSEGLHAPALRLLAALVASSKYGLPAVWLKYAECLTALQRNSEAIEAYRSVVSLAPQHVDARIKLAELLLEGGDADGALIVLKQDPAEDILDTSLLHRRCVILKSKGDLEEYLEVGRLLLSRHFFTIRNAEELSALRKKDTHEHLKTLRESRGEPVGDVDVPIFQESRAKLSYQTERDLLEDLFSVACELKKFKYLQYLAFSALGSKHFNERRATLELTCLFSSYYNGDYANAFHLIREYFFRLEQTDGMWNFFNLIMNRTTICNRFIVRLHRTTENRPLNILFGNYSLTSGTYKYALKEYISCYKQENTPLLALLCGVTMCNMAGQKFSNKHTLVTQCFAFMSYYEKLRKVDQEVYYNIGRAYHQLGLMHLACQYYQKALKAKPESDPRLDLSREIAFNLHLIYKKTAPDVARMYLTKYIIID